jgi:hypothetical protein
VKILLLYAPRCGSTSILKYFEKSKPEYECFNEPWYEWMIQHHHKERYTYEELVSKENIFIKSSYRTFPVPFEKALEDFDKVVILLRKDRKKQLESYILTHKQAAFLNYSRRKYWVDSITEREWAYFKEIYEEAINKLLDFSSQHRIPVYWYEDLYFNSFDNFFKELDLKYDREYYEEFLDISKKYRIEDVFNKKITSLI